LVLAALAKNKGVNPIGLFINSPKPVGFSLGRVSVAGEWDNLRCRE
jgi:hypothetical protein